MCKKLGHGSNYGGQPKTLAGQAKVPETVVRDFQPKYFKAFPSHIRWHGHVDTQLKRVGCFTTLTGRKRWFFGRRYDPATFREAVAYDPQGSLADIVNRAMLRIWRWSKSNSIPVYIVMHDHDALTFMYPEATEATILPQLQELLVEAIPLAHGRELRIPYDCKVGWNKGDFDYDHPEKNPDGLKDYVGEDKRTRRPEVSIMDRILHRSYG
jgi:DNA polymerase I-like protein with 3'-5' exonuclease and polymerase domains